MKYFFHSSAEIELNEAIDYYEQCKSGLGSEFVKEVYSAIQLFSGLSYSLKRGRR
jgi:hypothetical protein